MFCGMVLLFDNGLGFVFESASAAYVMFTKYV